MKFILTITFLLTLAITSAAQIIVVTAPEVKTVDGESFDTLISAQNLNDVGAYQFNIHYDANIIQPVNDGNFGCTLEDTIAYSAFTVLCNGNEAGNLRTVIYGTGSLYGDGMILKVHWTAIGVGGSPLKLTNGHFYAWHPYGEVPSSYVNGLVWVE